jgi:cobalt-zinc-cadmium efflux system outer membrane protein
MFHHRFRTFALSFGLLSATTLSAETLQQLQEEAFRNNPHFRVLQASVAAAQGGVTSAKIWQNPELSVGPGVRENVASNGPPKPGFNGTFEFNQLFLFPGKRQLLVAIAQRNVEISKIALEGFRFQLATSVRKAFYEQVAAQQIVKLRREQIKSAQTFYDAAVKRAESGYASDFEAVKGQADLIDAQKLARAAEGEVATARIELNTLLGRDPAKPLDVTGNLENAAPGKTSGGYIALALARNPSLRAQQMQADVAGLSLRKTRFGRRPDFSLGPAIEYSPNAGERVYAFRATVALPLWNRSQGEIETALAEQQRALAEIEKLRLEIIGAVTKSSAKVDVARDQLALYTPAFLDKLKAFVAQAEKSYAQSATTVLIYLDAKRTYFEALANYYETLGKVAASRAELESAIGVPLELTP